MTGRPALILHGGAGARRERDYTREMAHMGEVVAAMKARLDAGAPALDVAVEATVLPESSSRTVIPGAKVGRASRDGRAWARGAGAHAAVSSTVTPIARATLALAPRHIPPTSRTRP